MQNMQNRRQNFELISPSVNILFISKEFNFFVNICKRYCIVFLTEEKGYIKHFKFLNKETEGKKEEN